MEPFTQSLQSLINALNWADIGIISIIGISMLVSLVRGLMREAVSLITWFAAIIFSLHCARLLADRLVEWVPSPSLRLMLSLVALFIIAFAVGALVNMLTGQLLKRAGLSGLDRFLGMLFGAIRGALVVAVMVLLAKVFAADQDPWWHESVLIPYFLAIAQWLQSIVPEKVHQVSHFLNWQGMPMPTDSSTVQHLGQNTHDALQQAAAQSPPSHPIEQTAYVDGNTTRIGAEHNDSSPLEALKRFLAKHSRPPQYAKTPL